MNGLLIGLAVVIDFLQFIFFIVLLAFQLMTPVGGGVAGAVTGAAVCYNLSSGAAAITNAAACLLGGGLAGSALSAFAIPIGMAIDVALSSTFGVLLLLLMWVSGRFYFMPVAMGFAGEMMPGINSFMPGWTMLVLRCIRQYKAQEGGAAKNTGASTLGFIRGGLKMAGAVAGATALVPGLSIAERILPAEKMVKETAARIPLQTRNFMDGIRRPNTGNKDTYAKTA